uniref:Centrosomal protein 350 n=1 Tax=Pseudonaja textilis TaxID=8673 RepID=A0A670Y2E4_PSETE
MWSKKANEFPLHNPKFSQNRNSIRDLTTAWNSFSQTKATLQHIENKLEVAPISTARLDTVMEKKPSISTTRKISRKGCRSSSQNKESSFRRPLRATTLDSNVSKKGHVEFRQPLSSFRDSLWSPSYETSCQLEARPLKYKEAGNKAEGSGMIHDKGEPDLHGRDLKSSSFTEETVVRYLNDHPAINALQSSDVVNPTKLEEESEESRGEEYTKTSPSSVIQNELKELQLVESSASSASTSSAHRLDILKQHQHGDKLEKLKERIRKQWECSDELTVRGHNPEYSDHPVTITAPENIVTPKIRKVATAPMVPSYKGFNPSEAKIRTPDGKVWCEEEFLNLSRELCQDLEFQLDLTPIKTPIEKKEKKGHKPVRKTQKMAQLSSPYSKSGGANTISTASWRDGQRLAKKILGPVPKIEQPNTQMLSSDRNEKDKSIKTAQITEADCNMPVAVKPLTTCPERSSSKIRGKNNLKKKDAAPHNEGLGDDRVNKDFLPVEIRGILDDLQLDSVAQDSEKRNEICHNQESEPPPFSRSHSPGKKKSDKVPTSEDTQFILKKRHYDADEVRQYIVRQQEERKKRKSEEKKAQKEATQQKNKRLQELYKKQKEAVANKTKTTSTSETVTKQLQETYSKLFMEQTLLENPALSVQEVQSKPGYQPSGESDKENKAQERPVSASSSSDMSLSEPPHPLVRDNTLEPLRIHPEKLSSIAQFPSSKSVLNGAFFSQLLSLDNMGILQKDFESVTSSRRSHNTAMGSMSSTPQPFMLSAVQPTINHYKHKLDRIEALKATAASLSNRIESEAKKLAGAGINYEAAWHTEHDLLDQGDTCWAKASSPPVREDDVFSARLQKMLATCNSHTTFDDNPPGMENLNEFKKLPESISPHTGAVGLPGNNIPEEILGNLSQKQTCSAGPENKPAVPNDSADSISEGLLSDGLLSEEEGEKPYNPSLKVAEALNEKEFCVADKTGFETIKEFQKEAENYLPIFTQIRNGPKPWEELVKGSPHSVINIFTKSFHLCGKVYQLVGEFLFFVFIFKHGFLKYVTETESLNGFPNDSLWEKSKASLGSDYGLEQAKHLLSSNAVSNREQEVNPDSDSTAEELSGHSLRSIVYNSGSMRFSPAGLQHRLSAELNYLSTIEESVHQLSDIERVRGISLAQQESVSLALILKSQQQRHERDLALLKLKAEQEMLENQRNLEEAKQKAAQAHAESLHQLAQSHQEAAETLQDTTSKIATHQLETALLTADTARQIREMTERARFQISDAVGTTAAPVTTLFDQEWKQGSASLNINSGLLYESPSSKETKKLSHREKPSSSIEEEAPTAINDSLQNISIPSIHDERDSTSVATEYSLKFDESMTEDEIEEQSFRSLLPSESHRRINLKKRNHQIYSDEEASPGKSPIKELNLPFSAGQDSFSKFTMEMVRQYMREEEMRAAHQSSLLRLREKALKEKTKAELAWLEHQKRHLRDKGEDDKMPPIRKKQRGLLLKLQQEKAEIKRLQEANKAARKERQLILKQQEEIERIRQTTIKLQEKLKSAGESKEHRTEDDKKQTHCSSPQPTDAEAYSPSSISSSETSSIMQKLKKMRSRMDEKFLTKREQKLMQRRQYAEELLQWKQRLDAEEAEIRQIEKQALAAWEKELHKTKANKKGAGDQKSDQKETASEGDSPMPPCSRLNSESSVPEELSNLVVESIPSQVSEIQGEPGSLDHTVTEGIVYTQEPESAVSPGKPSSCKSSVSLSKQESNKQTQKSGGKQLSSTKSQDISYSWSDESLSMTQSETTSDQSDIESRIWALKNEVRKKKSVVYRLKKEQKKRLKEKLKAQEASLIKQLETYDEFIKKTEEELNEDFETTPTAKPQIKTPSSVTEKPKLKPPPLHRSETSKSWKSLTDSERSRGSLESIAEHIDALPPSEQSESVNTMKFTEAEIQTEKQSHTASTVLKILRKSSAESDKLDSLLPSAILKDLGNTSKISPISLNKSEDAVSYDCPTTRSIVQETAESKELEVEIASQTYEISNASVFDLNQNNSVPLKREVPPETELLEKNQFVLEGISVQEIKEMPSERFNDDESITSVKSVSEQISICEEQSYSSDFEESSLGTDISKSEIVLTEYQRDVFQAPTLPSRQDTGSQGENSLYTRPPRSESPGFGSEDEISECLSEKSLSVADSIQSERLLELKSPTEFVKNKDCGDVEKELFDDDDDDLCWGSSFKAPSEKQEDILRGFSIGDRVLVSNIYSGTLKFKGWTNFDKGFWAGVELDEPEGNNNGSYNGIQYFDCKENYGIFAPPEKISLFSKSFGNDLDSKENSFFKHEQDNQHKTNQEGLDTLEKEKNKRNTNEKSPRESSALKGSIGAGDYVKFNKSSDCLVVISTVDGFDQETSGFDSPKSSKNDNGMLPPAISNIHKEDSAIEVGGDLDSNFPKKWKHRSVWQEQTENRFSPSNLEKSATPLLDLLTKERSQLEAQLKVPSQEKEDLLDREERVGLLADSLLQGFVKDTVSQFQQIKKARNEKIHFSNQGLSAVQENNLATNEQQRFLVVSELDDGEEVSSPDMCPRPESPVFGASGQEELAKRLAELELSREFLNVLGDDQDWFDEDFGLSSHKLPQNQVEESAVLPKIELPKVSPKPCEEPLAAPYVAEEVEELVHAAAEKLWKYKELGLDLQALSNPRDINESPLNDDIETVSKQIYKKAVFDLTREIFEEIFAEDPNLNQPLWMKPSRIISGYFRRVKDPSDLEEIKVFITAEVLKLLNLRKESNNKTDWQKMMKFGRKKKDRVDHILVQELHEEEAQWVNYDEDELYVKMQLADGIFEALIRDTIDLLNQIFEKQKMFV